MEKSCSEMMTDRTSQFHIDVLFNDLELSCKFDIGNSYDM